MRCFYATKGKPQEDLSPIEEKAFQDDGHLLRGAISSVLGEIIIDLYLSISDWRMNGKPTETMH
jgi:hypothetical protein